MQLVSKRVGVMTAGLVLLGAAGMAQAQTAGSNVISLGWLHATPHNESTPLTATSINGTPVNIVQPGTGFAALSATTVGLTFAHYFTDNISAEFIGGFPTKLKFVGTGTLEKAGVIGEAMPLSPTVFVRYHFYDAESKFRPYVGLGVNYTKFVQGKITNPDFVHGLLGPGSTATVSASSSWNPAFVVGASYAIDEHWSYGVSVSYVPIKTNATLTGTTAGGVVVVSHASDKLRPVTTFVNIGYRF
nr:OmpW family outer membrane protein [Collimonas sp. OK307]